MIDETTDITNQEQVAIVLWKIDDNFETYGELIGLYMISSIEAECLAKVIKDTIIKFNLHVNKETLWAVLWCLQYHEWYQNWSC